MPTLSRQRYVHHYLFNFISFTDDARVKHRQQAYECFTAMSNRSAKFLNKS
jgi:hypothetical protein